VTVRWLRPPNPRLQRTRLRAPLSRKPLGRRSTSRGISLVLVGTFVASLAWGDEHRQARPQFKGMELYSWQVGLKWRFSLLPGTNRRKSIAQITARKVTVTSVAKLKERLARLAPGENIFWLNPSESPFVYPNSDVACELVAFCERMKMKLELGKPCAAA
jgi:hypothetical protein